MFINRIIKNAAILPVLAIIGFAGVGMAGAQGPPCGSRSEIVPWLEGQFQERQAGFGLIDDRAVMELYKSTHGSWTLIVTDRLKRTCLVASGNSWVDVPPPAIPAQTP